MSLNRVQIPSPNYSSRSGSRIRLIVLHTAEGATTYQSLGNYFKNPSNQVSSHVGIDDTPNTVGEYVARANKAWTAANANPVAIQAELCAFAAWSPSEWQNHQVMLQNCAQWIAEESAFFGIPIQALTPAAAQGNGIGICQHIDLGAWGGGHVDCGPNFPYEQVLEMASGTPAVTAASSGSEDSTLCVVTAPGRVDLFVVGTDHRVYQAWAPDWIALTKAPWGYVGDENTWVKSISAAWSPDYKTLYLAAQGADDHPYLNVWNGTAWSGWAVNEHGTCNPDPYALQKA